MRLVCSRCGSGVCLMAGGDRCRHTNLVREARTVMEEETIIAKELPGPPVDKQMQHAEVATKGRRGRWPR